MCRTRIEPELMYLWKIRCEIAVKSGSSLNALVGELAANAGCHPQTVRRHIDVDFCDRRRKASREYQRRQKAHRTYKRRYHRYYKRLVRHPEDFLNVIFATREDADLDTIVAGIREISGSVRFSSGTIRRILIAYALLQSNGPVHSSSTLIETEQGMWRYRPNRESKTEVSLPQETSQPSVESHIRPLDTQSH